MNYEVLHKECDNEWGTHRWVINADECEMFTVGSYPDAHLHAIKPANEEYGMIYIRRSHYEPFFELPLDFDLQCTCEFYQKLIDDDSDADTDNDETIVDHGVHEVIDSMVLNQYIIASYGDIIIDLEHMDGIQAEHVDMIRNIFDNNSHRIGYILMWEWCFDGKTYALCYLSKLYMIVSDHRIVMALIDNNNSLQEGDSHMDVYLIKRKHILVSNRGNVESVVVFKFNGSDEQYENIHDRQHIDRHSTDTIST